MSLRAARDTLTATTRDLLWAQWIDLGAAGTRGSGRTIIDPEALVLATLDIGRLDPRLFDEALDWLVLNGDLLDVTRLRRLMRAAALEQQRLGRAIIDLLRQRGSHTKWAALTKQWQANEAAAVYSPKALFHDAEGRELPIFGETDPLFASYGFMRPPLETRGMSEAPRLHRPCLVRLAMRALVGIGVRAEVLLYLQSHEKAHGRLIAARSDYSQRQVAEYLAGLADAGFAERFEDGKTVQYRLVPHMRRESSGDASYVDWARCLPAVGSLLADITHATATDSPYESAVRARQALCAFRDTLPIEGLDLPLPKPEDHPGESVLAHAEYVAHDTATEIDRRAISAG